MGLAFYCCVRGFFPKIQLYSTIRMDELLQLANATTSESLLELSSVLHISLSDWNQELSARSNKTRVEKPIPGTKDPTQSLKHGAKLNKKGKKAPSAGSDTSKKAVIMKTGTKPSHSSKGKSNLPLRAKVQPQTWLPSSKRLFLALLWK